MINKNDNFVPPAGMDPECVELCVAMNGLPGVETHESCCGHGKQPYRIFFRVSRLTVLPRVIYFFMGCHCGFYGWSIQATTDCGASPVKFMVEGPVGAYEESYKIARLIEEAFGQAKTT